MPALQIAGGHVIDPAHGIDAVRDLWVDGGRIIPAPDGPDTKADRVIDARGYLIMPGGVDVHSHIAGAKVNAARVLRPEDKTGALERGPGRRSGALGSVPSSFATGYQYAGLGYTTVIDAAIPPLGARLCHLELDDVPILDKAILILMGNNHLAMELVREGARDRLADYLAWVLRATRAHGIKVVNPGGVERWKQGAGALASLDETVDGFGVTPRQVLVELAQAADALALPHPIHLHGLSLGLPGNAAITLETMRALDGHRAHFAHIQFHSYGGDPSTQAGFASEAARLADYVNAHANLTVDVGQVLFGETTSMTADGAVGAYLHRLTGRKWYSHDLEQETGCGVVPITYHDRNAVHALQWAIGLEWFLTVEDPWRIALSTDHPNGASFLSYPEVMALLMSKNYRDEAMARLPESVRTHSGLGGLGREYSLSEIAIVTRAGPARALGLDRKGHLGPGADADITIYAPDADRRRMFALPRWVIKAGHVIVDDGELRAAPMGATWRTVRPFDEAIVPWARERFERASSIRFENFALREDEAWP